MPATPNAAATRAATRPRADSDGEIFISPEDRRDALNRRLAELRAAEMAAIEAELKKLDEKVPATVPATVLVSTPVVHNTKHFQPRPAGKYNPHPRTSCRATPHSPSTPHNKWDSVRSAHELMKRLPDDSFVNLEDLPDFFVFPSCAGDVDLLKFFTEYAQYFKLDVLEDGSQIVCLTPAGREFKALHPRTPQRGPRVAHSDRKVASSPVETGAVESPHPIPYTHTPPKRGPSPKVGKTGGASRVAGPVPDEMGPALFEHLLTKNPERGYRFCFAVIANPNNKQGLYFDTQGYRITDVIAAFPALFQRDGEHHIVLVRSDDAAAAGASPTEEK